MFRGIVAVVVFIGGVIGSVVPSQAQDDRLQASRQVVRTFMTELKGKLEEAVSQKGPAGAIAVCRREAPDIAARLSGETGWWVARTSLKVRNPGNEPDAWERQVLESFEARRRAGEDPSTLEHTEVVEMAGGRVYRYMKAIPTGPVCVLCHGGDLDPSVQAQLQRYYPQDRATGFAPGDIRGAFTLIEPLSPGD